MPFRNAILAFLLLAVIVAGLIFFGTRTSSGPSYQGRSARAWLDQVKGPPLPGKTFEETRQIAFAAFRAMGTNAHPFLLASLSARESLVERAYRFLYGKIPARIVPLVILRCLPPPTYVEMTREEADEVLINVYPRPPVADVLALADSEARIEVFILASLYIGPSDTNQIPLLISACRDANAGVRQQAITCLGAIGPNASNSLPTLASVCADTNLLVRGAAALAVFHVSTKTNEAARILQGVIAQSSDASELYNASIGLVMMTNSIPLATTTLTSLLTNRTKTWVHGPAASWLGIIGPSASNAVPLLRPLADGPDAYVRQSAKDALTKIQPGAATK